MVIKVTHVCQFAASRPQARPPVPAFDELFDVHSWTRLRATRVHVLEAAAACNSNVKENVVRVSGVLRRVIGLEQATVAPGWFLVQLEPLWQVELACHHAHLD